MGASQTHPQIAGKTESDDTLQVKQNRRSCLWRMCGTNRPLATLARSCSIARPRDGDQQMFEALYPRQIRNSPNRSAGVNQSPAQGAVWQSRGGLRPCSARDALTHVCFGFIAVIRQNESDDCDPTYVSSLRSRFRRALSPRPRHHQALP